MKHLLKNNLYFFIPYTLFLLVCLVFIFSYSKPELHILSNKANHPFFDEFFKYATWFGDGIVIAVLTVILIFIKFRYAIVFLVGSIVTSGLVQFFKRVVLDEMYRPIKYFEMYESYRLHIIEGVNLHTLHSFPSGHSATAFNLFFMLALIIKNRLVKFLCFLAAAIVAYSRVYLSQHFLIDIVAGSFIGVFFILVVFRWSKKWENRKLDKSVIDFIKLSHDK